MNNSNRLYFGETRKRITSRSLTHRVHGIGNSSNMFFKHVIYYIKIYKNKKTVNIIKSFVNKINYMFKI